MSHKRFYQVSAIVVVVTVSLLIGFLVWRHRADQKALIGKEQAIQYAIQACNPRYGLQPMEPPTETEAQFTTWGKTREGSHGSDPRRPVWVVRMTGRWLLLGGPQLAPNPSNPTPEPAYWNQCTIIIDARTGESLSIPIQ